jgi:transcriptional regulator with XRE-family HTH domain
VTQDSKWGLAQVVRGLREHHGITQEELGRKAGYLTGAGVAISRLEHGLLQPSPDKFSGIAEALGLTPQELEARAASPTADDLAIAAKKGGAADTASDRTMAPPGQKELNARKKMVEKETAEQTTVITELSEAFHHAHERARIEFFEVFMRIGARVKGAPRETTQPRADGVTDPGVLAANQIKSYANGVVRTLAVGTGSAAAGAAVGGAAAYVTFVTAAALGTASTGAAISGLSGIAATNATLALLGGGTLAAGGAGVAGGMMVLTGIVALPALILFAGGLALMVKRNRKQRQEFDAQLREAEAQLVATKPGIEALQDILPRAVVTLDYIATHAGHAVHRWEDRFGSGSMAWNSLGQAEQRRYQDFVEIAAAQIAIVNFNYEGLLITSDSDRDQLIQLADELLTQSHDIVKARV